MEWIVIFAAGAIGGILIGWWMSSRTRQRPASPLQATAAPNSAWSKPSTAPALHKPNRTSDIRSLRPRDTSPETIQAPKSLDPEQRRQRIRDRYVASRFAGALRDSRELLDCSKVIKAARLYFEDENHERGDELLQLAIAAMPHEKRLWLARLEILFLSRDAEHFVAVAKGFQLAFPRDELWVEITRLGHALAPGESLFGRTGGETDRQEHYGPWPNTPNWIEAPWDLTAEVAGAEFHRRMRARLQRAHLARPLHRQGASR